MFDINVGKLINKDKNKDKNKRGHHWHTQSRLFSRESVTLHVSQ